MELAANLLDYISTTVPRGTDIPAHANSWPTHNVSDSNLELHYDSAHAPHTERTTHPHTHIPPNLCKKAALESHELCHHLFGEILEVGGLNHI